MNEWIVIIFSAGILLVALAVRQLYQWVLYTQHLEARAVHYEREAERLRQLALVEHMAALNLVEAIRRGEGAAAVEGWVQKNEGETTWQLNGSKS